MAEENKALGRREIEEIFNGSNLDAADEIYASDFVDHDRAFSWEMHGPEEIKEYVGVFHSAFPRLPGNARGPDSRRGQGGEPLDGAGHPLWRVSGRRPHR